MTVDLNQVTRVFEKVDTCTVARWAPTSVNFERLGFYQQIARAIFEKSRDLGFASDEFAHAELGVGLGFLMGYLREMFSKALLVGVDTNPIALQQTRDYLMRVLHTPVLWHGGASLWEDRTRHCLNRKFDTGCSELVAENKNRNPVYLLGDDATKLDALQVLLGDRSLNSASLTFFAKNATDLWLHEGGMDFPIDGPVPQEQLDAMLQKYAQIDLLVQRKIYGKLAAIMAPGSLLTVTRESGARREVVRGLDRRSVDELFTRQSIWNEREVAGAHFRYWRPVEAFVSEPYTKPREAVGAYVVKDGKLVNQSMGSETELRISSLFLQRNHTPFMGE